jgi:sugar lactone lactonase YvrE
MDFEARVEWAAGAALAEGPCWDAERQRLYWVDIDLGLLHVYDPAGRKDRAIEIGQPVGAVVLRRSGGVVLAVRDGFLALDPETGARRFLGDPEAHLPENRFNDGKCDPAGRFWAGTMGRGPHQGSLYCLGADLAIHRRIEGVSISNGLAWSLDERVMYYVDSRTREVAAFDYEKATGAIGDRRVVIRIPEGMGLPDGMSIDEAGMLWIALWDGGRVARFDPQSGALCGELRLPVSRPTSCCFGGPGLDELYVTSARSGLSREALAEQPLAGSIFRCSADVRGGPAWAFLG